MSKGCILLLISSRNWSWQQEATVLRDFCSTQFSSLGNETWWAGILLPVYSLSCTPSSLHALWLSEDDTLFFCLPPSKAHSDIDKIPSHYKYSTHCLNHPLSLHEQEPVPGPGHRKPITHPHFIPLQPTEISLGLHTITYLPSWSFLKLGEERILSTIWGQN